MGQSVNYCSLRTEANFIRSFIAVTADWQGAPKRVGHIFRYCRRDTIRSALAEGVVMRTNHLTKFVIYVATAAVCGKTAIAGVTSSWVTPVSGQWSDSSKWSTAPVFPNNGATTYDAVID